MNIAKKYSGIKISRFWGWDDEKKLSRYYNFDN